MARQWFMPGVDALFQGGMIDEDGTREYFVPGVGFLNEGTAFTLANLALHHSGASELGGAIGVELTDDALNNLWDDVSAGDAGSGDTEFRCVYVKNTHPLLSAVDTKVSIKTDPGKSDFEIALGESGLNGNESTVPDEDTAP